MKIKNLFRGLFIGFYSLFVITVFGVTQQNEQIRNTEIAILNEKFNEASDLKKIIVLNKFLDQINGDESVRVYKGTGNFFSPSQAKIELSFGDNARFTSFIVREFGEEKLENIDITIFTAFHEMGHSLTMGVKDMKKYSEGLRAMRNEYARYKKEKKLEFIAFQTGDADNYIEETQSSILNLHYRRIPAEKIADLVAFYLYEEHYDILLDIMNGKDVQLSRARIIVIKSGINRIKQNYLK